MSLFVSVDLLLEQFVGWSPYHYDHNNPVNMTDPTGMAPEGLDHDYRLGKEGKMTMIRKTNDDFHRIYNEGGSDNIAVSKNFIDNSKYLSNGGKSYPLSNNDLKYEGVSDRIFNFFADNTVHEYSMNEFQNSKTGEKSGFVHTSFDKGIVRGGTKEVESRINSNINLLLTRDIHSHPGGGINSESVYPSGFYPTNWTGPGLVAHSVLYGDGKYYRDLKAQFGERIKIDFEVYVPKAPTVKIFNNDKKAFRINNGVMF